MTEDFTTPSSYPTARVLVIGRRGGGGDREGMGRPGRTSSLFLTQSHEGVRSGLGPFYNTEDKTQPLAWLSRSR